MILKFEEYRNNKFRFVCEIGTTFRELQNELSEKYELYRQRILPKREFVQFGHTIFDVTIVGGLSVK